MRAMFRTERDSGARVGVSGVLSLTLILALCWVANDAFARPKQLNSIEVEDLVKGNTVFGYNPSDDSSYTMFHSGNGAVRAELRSRCCAWIWSTIRVCTSASRASASCWDS